MVLLYALYEFSQRLHCESALARANNRPDNATIGPCSGQSQSLRLARVLPPALGHWLDENTLEDGRARASSSRRLKRWVFRRPRPDGGGEMTVGSRESAWLPCRSLPLDSIDPATRSLPTAGQPSGLSSPYPDSTDRPTDNQAQKSSHAPRSARALWAMASQRARLRSRVPCHG